MRHSKLLLVTAVALVISLSMADTGFAQAPNNPVGLWSLTFYNDNTPALTPMATQNICFVAGGTWYSTTFPAWNGRWFQKGNNAAGNGDRVRVLGNWASGFGNDSADLNFIHVRLMTGSWNEWIDGFGFFVWTQVTLTRIGNLCPPPLGPEVDSNEEGLSPSEREGVKPPTCEPTTE